MIEIILIIICSLVFVISIEYISTSSIILLWTIMTYLIISLVVSVAKAETIDYTQEKLICNYDLTIILQDDTVLFIAMPLLGELKYTITNDNGYKLLAVDFSKDLTKIKLNTLYNPKFIENVDGYKCRRIKWTQT